MPSGEARRERLASPLALGMAAATFVAAFAALGLARMDAGVAVSAGRGDRGDLHEAPSSSAPDALTLAYLRARAADGHTADPETIDGLVALATQGRVAEARELIDDYPSLIVDPSDAQRLALEFAAADWHHADTAIGRERADVVLRSRLAALRSSDAGVRHRRLLERGAVLASQLRDHAAIERLYASLAAADPDRAEHWYGRCGQTLADQGARRAAIDCLMRAERASPSDSARIGWQRARLAISTGEPGQRALGETLLSARASTALDLQQLATVLLANEMPDLAARAYGRLAADQPSEAGRWLALAARWAEAAGQPAQAAAWLDRLPTSQLSADHRRQIERLLLAAGDEAAALERVAARVASAPEDAELLDEAVRLAESVGAVAEALQWNSAYLDTHGEDAIAIDRQVSLAVANADPALARRWAERALRQDPENAAQRRRLAQLAEWTAAPSLALEQQRWLANRDGGVPAYREVARLAESLRRPAEAADALRELARRDVPDVQTVTRLVRQYELDGRPSEAAEALNEVMRRHGETAWRLRELARLHERHLQHLEALTAWERFAIRIGRTSEETLARIDLQWRLGERDAAAALAQQLAETDFRGPATDRQASLLAEIGWRYRRPAIAELARPLLAGVADEEQRLRQARRAINALEEAGQPAQARRAASAQWQRSGSAEFALIAWRLAIDTGDTAAAERWLTIASADETLITTAGYWTLRAAQALQRGESDAARTAYAQALVLSPLDPEANGGLLWLAIGNDDAPSLGRLLDTRLDQLERVPTLWPAIAVAHLAAGRAAASLPWFERALQSVGTDYALVLSWADALERSGQLERARGVLAWAIDRLRPLLVDGIVGQEASLVRQYGQVLARYGRADDNEAWMRLMLASDPDWSEASRIWREDMAIAWLMSTERHEHARLIMARRHAARLATPVWQDLALALRVQDRQRIRAMLESGAQLSAGNRMRALRAVGRDAEAFALAMRTLAAPGGAHVNTDDLTVAQAQYVQMRRWRPSHVTAGHTAGRSGELSIDDSVFALRHAPGVSGLGYALDVTRSRFASDTLQIDELDEAADVRLGVFHRSRRHDIALRAGVHAIADEQRLYGQVDGAFRDRRARHEVALSLAWQEPADESAELRLAGQRDRLRASLDSSLGERLFTRLGLNASELSSRADGQRLAKGLGTRAEIGLRDAAGSLSWSTSLSAEHQVYDRTQRLPDAFALSSRSSLDRVLAARRTAVTLNASLARGGTQSDFPDIASPRWYLATGAGHVWPGRTFGVQLDAGAGVRVIGNDELGIALGHEHRIGATGGERNATRLGVNYRYHF